MHRDASSTFILVLVALCVSVTAFHVESGTKCTSVGAACSYISDDSSAKGSKAATVNGFCAPDLTCASNGAKCSNDNECFNYCGGGTCGGTGAGCNTQDTFALNQITIACASGFTCSANGSVGKCVEGAVTTSSTASKTSTTMGMSTAASTAASSGSTSPAKVTPQLVGAPSNTGSAAVSNGSLAARRHKKRLPNLSNRQVRAADLRAAKVH